MKFAKAVKSQNDDEKVETKANRKRGKPGVESSVKSTKNKKPGNTGLTGFTDKSGTGPA